MGRRRLLRWMLVSAAVAVPAHASADDRVVVVVEDGQAAPGQPPSTEVVVEGPPPQNVRVVQRPSTRPSDVSWFGLTLGAIVMPLSSAHPLSSSSAYHSDRMRLCTAGKHGVCGGLRGGEVRLNLFSTKGAMYPRFSAYLRSGAVMGSSAIQPRSADGHVQGEATGIKYVAVPIFLGFNLYAFKRFPLRPFVGAGLGVDVLRLGYTRWDAPMHKSTSARFGMEVHGGLELRLTNYIALSVEARQQVSMKRKIEGLPHFSTSGFQMMAGISFSLPFGSLSGHHDPSLRVVTVRRERIPAQPPAPPRPSYSVPSRRADDVPPPALTPPEPVTTTTTTTTVTTTTEPAIPEGPPASMAPVAVPN